MGPECGHRWVLRSAIHSICKSALYKLELLLNGNTTDIMQPAIVSSHFGPSNFGLAWGMVSYFVSCSVLGSIQADSQAALGSVVFSYIYAYLSEAIATKASTPAQCYGSECFNGTLGIAAVCCVISGLGFAWIGRRWKV